MSVDEGNDQFPHKCPGCKWPAYIGGNQNVDCSNRRCHLHQRFVFATLTDKKLVAKAYELKDDIFRARRDKRATVAMDALELIVSELLGAER